MIDEQLRRRLESLNRAPLPAPIKTDSVSTTRPRSSSNARSNSLNGAAARTMRALPGLLRCAEVVETSGGEHLRIRLPLDTLWKGGTKLVTARQEFLRSSLAASQEAMEPAVVIDAEFAALVSALPERAMVLDLETCGLAGAALFLVGLLRQIGGLPTIELLLARNYAEEAAVLESLWQTVAGHEVLVTFNGKSFDWPMVLERSIRHRLSRAPDRPLHHIDVLHHARRRWRKRLPDCRLQTLERHVCRRSRPADIPGHAIPAVYADYVRTGFERDMDIVLYHNAVDLLTLFDLALRLAA